MSVMRRGSGSSGYSSSTNMFLRGAAPYVARAAAPYVKGLATKVARRAISGALNYAQRVGKKRSFGGIPIQRNPGPRRSSHKKMKPCRVPVKVSKKFKSKVLQAVESNAAMGKYTMGLIGNLYPVNVAGSQFPTQDLWQGTTLLQTQAAGNATLTRTMEFFTADRVLDAASILFNGKTSDVNYTVTTNNFTRANLILEVPYQSVKVTMHNNSEVIKEVEWYECIAKSDTDLSALEQWIALLSTLATSENLGSIGVNQMYATPGQLKSFSNHFSYTSRTIRLLPGKSKSFTMTQKAQCYKMAKMLIGSDYPNLGKGIGVSCFAIVRNPTLSITTTTLPNYTGLKGDTVTAGYGVSIEFKCLYVIEAPELADDSQKFDKFYMNTYDTTAGSAPWSSLSLMQTNAVIAQVLPQVPYDTQAPIT